MSNSVKLVSMVKPWMFGYGAMGGLMGVHVYKSNMANGRNPEIDADGYRNPCAKGHPMKDLPSLKWHCRFKALVAGSVWPLTCVAHAFHFEVINFDSHRVPALYFPKAAPVEAPASAVTTAPAPPAPAGSRVAGSIRLHLRDEHDQ